VFLVNAFFGIEILLHVTVISAVSLLQDVDTTTKIIQVIGTPGYEEYLHRCLTAITKRKYSKRIHYLEEAIPKGLRKEMLWE
jgi:hypothetical protein